MKHEIVTNESPEQAMERLSKAAKGLREQLPKQENMQKEITFGLIGFDVRVKRSLFTQEGAGAPTLSGRVLPHPRGSCIRVRTGIPRLTAGVLLTLCLTGVGAVIWGVTHWFGGSNSDGNAAFAIQVGILGACLAGGLLVAFEYAYSREQRELVQFISKVYEAVTVQDERPAIGPSSKL